MEFQTPHKTVKRCKNSLRLRLRLCNSNQLDSSETISDHDIDNESGFAQMIITYQHRICCWSSSSHAHHHESPVRYCFVCGFQRKHTFSRKDKYSDALRANSDVWFNSHTRSFARSISAMQIKFITASTHLNRFVVHLRMCIARDVRTYTHNNKRNSHTFRRSQNQIRDHRLHIKYTYWNASSVRHTWERSMYKVG